MCADTSCFLSKSASLVEAAVLCDAGWINEAKEKTHGMSTSGSEDFPNSDRWRDLLGLVNVGIAWWTGNLLECSKLLRSLCTSPHVGGSAKCALEILSPTEEVAVSSASHALSRSLSAILCGEFEEAVAIGLKGLHDLSLRYGCGAVGPLQVCMLKARPLEKSNMLQLCVMVCVASVAAQNIDAGVKALQIATEATLTLTNSQPNVYVAGLMTLCQALIQSARISVCESCCYNFSKNVAMPSKFLAWAYSLACGRALYRLANYSAALNQFSSAIEQRALLGLDGLKCQAGWFSNTAFLATERQFIPHLENVFIAQVHCAVGSEEVSESQLLLFSGA